jgi:predicted O-methyltransferase YrrM
MTSKTLSLTPNVYDYYQKHTVRHHPVLESLRLATQEMSEGGMQIAPEQGAFMQLLIKMLGARKILELGTFTGYSTLAMALALPEHGKIIACDVSSEWTNMAQTYWQQAGVAHKIELRLAPALTSLQQLSENGEQGSFDFAFIDADKANYPAYYEAVLPLVRAGGVIAIDNVLWYGRVADETDNTDSTKVIRHLNHLIYQDQRVDMCMLPIGDGLTLAYKRK